MKDKTVNQVWDRIHRLGWSETEARTTPIRVTVGESTTAKQLRLKDEEDSGQRLCIYCECTKNLEEFKRHAPSSGGRMRTCSACLNLQIRLKRYGLSEDELLQHMRAQDFACIWCSHELDDSLHVDHCHETGKVRGLSCPACNWVIGDFKNSPAFLRRAAAWVSRRASLPWPTSSDRSVLWQKYFLTRLERDILLTAQGNSCGICGTKDPGVRGWVVDHVHAQHTSIRASYDKRVVSTSSLKHRRDQIRGVLCDACNKGLGHAKDDPHRLMKIAERLEQQQLDS